MPYYLKKVRNGYKVAKRDDPSKVFSKKALTKEQAMKQMHAIILSEHAKTHGIQGGVLPLTALLKNNIEGGGIIDSIKSRLKVFQGVRLNYRPKDREFINKYGDYAIMALSVYRAPLQKYVKTLLNIVTLGQFKKTVDAHFDEMYHLFLKIDLAKGADRKSIIIEKNETIIIKDFKESDVKNAQSLKLNIPPHMNLRGFLKQAELSTTPDMYFRYDPLSTNCQQYLLTLLKPNGILQMNPQAQQFIYQNPAVLRKELPQLSQQIMKKLTDVAATANVAIKGYGLQKLQTQTPMIY